MTVAARAHLAERQAALVAAILSPYLKPPTGFTAQALALARDAALRKRAWCVANAWPHMARALGPRFLVEFADYAELFPSPPAQGALVDGRRFAQRLAGLRRLPDLGKVQALAFDLNYTTQAQGWAARRLPQLRLTLIDDPPHLLVGVSFLGRAAVIPIPLGPRRLE